MAACAICELDALDVYFNSVGFEMPIFDGSAKVWVEEFNKVGFVGDSEPVEPLNETVVFVKKSIFFIFGIEYHCRKKRVL